MGSREEPSQEAVQGWAPIGADSEQIQKKVKTGPGPRSSWIAEGRGLQHHSNGHKLPDLEVERAGASVGVVSALCRKPWVILPSYVVRCSVFELPTMQPEWALEVGVMYTMRSGSRPMTFPEAVEALS